MTKEEIIEYIWRGKKDNDRYYEIMSKIETHTVDYSDISNKIKEEDIAKIIGREKNIPINNYKKIEDDCIGKKGIYIFYREKYEFLYVGECHTVNEKWSLFSRMKQHFKVSDNGGLIYKVSNGKTKEGIKLRNEFVKDVKLTYFFLDLENQDILFLESYLIAMLRPKYNYIDKSYDE